MPSEFIILIKGNWILDCFNPNPRGLLLVAKMSDRLGAIIKVESTFGKGTSFIFSHPIDSSYDLAKKSFTTCKRFSILLSYLLYC